MRNVRKERTNLATEQFRNLVASVGLAVSGITIVGVVAIIRSKVLHWRIYAQFFATSKDYRIPKPFDPATLEWGIDTRNTVATVVPDILLPTTFLVAWGWLLV